MGGSGQKKQGVREKEKRLLHQLLIKIYFSCFVFEVISE